LGLALGDALGRPWEGLPPQWIRAERATPEAVVSASLAAPLQYTDDTQMMIGVAETLVEEGCVVEDTLSRKFAANYDPDRGYGSGSRAIIEAILAEQDHRRLAATMFGQGSFGNGAAMRVAPVGAFFHDDLDRVWEEARSSAFPTHTHPLGVEGAQLLATGVALAFRDGPFSPDHFFENLLSRCRTPEFCRELTKAASAKHPADLASLGNGVEALASVPTALAVFAVFPDDFIQTTGNAILLGGDTDTIAAMAGALYGARSGAAALPSNLLSKLENGPQGKTYITRLATQLHEQHRTRQTP
jgi:poly(ADP-ribose) glycohydrolase ARH3